jgi:hypothetical protein
MQTRTSIWYFFLVITICSYFFTAGISDPIKDPTSEVENCHVITLQSVNDHRYALSQTSGIDCPVYSSSPRETEYDEEGWGISPDLGGVILGQEIYYEQDGHGAYWICYPDAIIKACQNISLEEGWHLEAYHFYENGNANTKTYALPDGTHLLPPEQALTTQNLDDLPEDLPGFWPWPPTPEYADPDVMAHIIGDDTYLSYIEASILSRELQEIGASWHGLTWGVSHIINTTELIDEQKNNTDSAIKFGNLNWTEPVPESMEPVVCCSDTICNVTWYTRTRLNQEKVACNVDTYQRGSYLATTNTTILATGTGGFYF